MTIDIIKIGKLPEKRKMRGTCNHCSTQVMCEYGDTHYVDDGPCGQFGWRAVKCPLCNRNINVREVE